MPRIFDELALRAADMGSLLREQLRAGAMRASGWGADHAQIDYAGQARAAVEAIHPARMQLELREREVCSPTTHCLRFARLDGRLPPFRAGQFVSLAVEIGGVRTSRPYSVSSPPGAPLLELTVRDDPDGFVAPWLCREAPVGWRTVSSGPLGGFFHEPLRDGDDLVFVAGGSGVTPFVSMLRELEARGWPRRVTLLYGNRTPGDVPFATELRRLARKNPAFRVVFVYSDAPEAKRVRKGLLDRAQVARAVQPIEGHRWYLCGPEPMLLLVERELASLGVARHHVRAERFGPPTRLTEQAGWPQGLSPAAFFQLTLSNGATIPARAGEPILVALERAGHAPPSSCRTGACGDCRVKLLGGQVFVPEDVGLRQSDRALGYLHACMAWPASDLRIGTVR